MGARLSEQVSLSKHKINNLRRNKQTTAMVLDLRTLLRQIAPNPRGRAESDSHPKCAGEKSETRRPSVKQILRASFTIAFLAVLVGLAPVSKDRVTALPIVYAQSGCMEATLS